MPKFSANLSFLFAELPFGERFAAAAEAGFSGVEFMFPYAFPAGQVAGWQRAAGVATVLFNLPPGDWAAGERGIACLPGREAEFMAGVERALDYAAALDCPRLHCMAGIAPAGVAEATLRATYVANLRRAARLAAGRELLIEPINTVIDMPGYWLATPDKALDLLAEIGEANVRLQLDAYHVRAMGSDPAALVERLGATAIGHVQIADFPGRHEPGSGTTDFAAFFAALAAAGYPGWVGCEYRPVAGTSAGLVWREKLPGGTAF